MLVFKRLSGLVILSVVSSMGHATGLVSLSDTEMAETQGQALFNLSYIAPGGSNPSANTGFYRVGLEAEMRINANIRSLQLGCGGTKGAGECDIDLENVRLTGRTAGPDGTFMSSDAVLNNPYFEVAIKNPTSASNREITGLRFGALSVLGKMSIGENPNINNLADDTGIKTITGDLTARVTNATLTNVGVTTFGGCCIIGPTTATITEHVQPFVLRRDSAITLSGAEATAAGLTLGNVWLNNQPLRTIHQLDLAEDNGSATKDFYLSLQSESVKWQKISTASFTGTVAAEKGWWISIPRVQLPNITSNQSIRIDTLDAIGGVFGARTDINPVDLQQTPVDNCYGGLTFC